MPKGSRILHLYKRSLTIVSREVSALNELSRNGKLSEKNAMDLARYVKLLKDMSEGEEAAKAKLAAKVKADAQSPEDILNALAAGTAKQPKG